MNRRVAKVRLETDRQHIVGEITLPIEGYRNRVSDHINRLEIEFLALCHATVTPLAGEESWSAPVLLVSRRHIRFVVPLDD